MLDLEIEQMPGKYDYHRYVPGTIHKEGDRGRRSPKKFMETKNIVIKNKTVFDKFCVGNKHRSGRVQI